MENARAELDISILIAKEAIKVAHCWIVLLIAPSVFSVLKMNFLELRRIESIPETHPMTSIHICPVFVSCPVYLVEIAGDQPLCSDQGLLTNQLLEESIFKVATRRSVDSCKLEGGVGVGNRDLGRKREGAKIDIFDLNRVFIPEESNTATCANSRALRKVLQTIAAKEGGDERVDILELGLLQTN